MSASYTIQLPQFKGPFDLLLFFIERDELDIYDIPIAKITDDFLSYIRQMESLNIDVASEFILVAATLMRIKAKMLIPRKEVDEAGNEIDPREELVARLLEYKRYKGILEDMRLLEQQRASQTGRGNVADELQIIAEEALVDVELERLTLFKLLKAFERVMTRLEDKSKVRTVHEVVDFKFTIHQQQEYLLSQVQVNEKTEFEVIFGKCEDRLHGIVTFLALLELLNMNMIKIIQGIGINNFWLTVPDEEEESTEVENSGEEE